MFKRVAIIGLGLIGGSVGLALQQSKAAKEIWGFDLRYGVCERAKKMGAIHHHARTLAETVGGADLVLLATPVGVLRTLFQELAPALSSDTVVTDVASTKAQVISWAEEFLPSYVCFVGGHPMAGKEVSGIEASDPNLFKNCVYCLTPTPRTRPTAVAKVLALIELLGAHVRFLEPAEHDGQVAAISHVPFLASTALMNTIAQDASWGDASLLASSGFRDITRLAAGNAEMYRDICLTNSSAIIRLLDAYVDDLNELRDRIARKDRTISEDFVRSKQAREQWQATQEKKKSHSS